MKNIDIVIKSNKWFNFFKDENDVQINFNNIIKKISSLSLIFVIQILSKKYLSKIL